MANTAHLLQYLDETFRVSDFPDYSNALNGLQVEGPQEIERIIVAVDASEATINMALERGGHLLLSHHGLFWDGFGPISGPRFRKVKRLIQGDMGLYALHLPLDAHPEIGNSTLLVKALGLEPEGSFFPYQGEDIGWWTRAEMGRDALTHRISKAVDGPVRLIPGGPESVECAGVVTGGGGGALIEAASRGFDALITGEAAHHNYHDAMEMGINLYLAGHYATETFGIKALGDKLGLKFDVKSEFLDLPTGF